jgi:hypothetical protein
MRLHPRLSASVSAALRTRLSLVHPRALPYTCPARGQGAAPDRGQELPRVLATGCFGGQLLLFGSPLDAAAVANPNSHSFAHPRLLDGLARFHASFSAALRGELHRPAAMRAGGRRCQFRHVARIPGSAKRTLDSSLLAVFRQRTSRSFALTPGVAARLPVARPGTPRHVEFGRHDSRRGHSERC